MSWPSKVAARNRPEPYVSSPPRRAIQATARHSCCRSDQTRVTKKKTRQLTPTLTADGKHIGIPTCQCSFYEHTILLSPQETLHPTAVREHFLCSTRSTSAEWQVSKLKQWQHVLLLSAISAWQRTKVTLDTHFRNVEVERITTAPISSASLTSRRTSISQFKIVLAQ